MGTQEQQTLGVVVFSPHYKLIQELFAFILHVYFMVYMPRICNICYLILHESVPFFLCREPSLWSFTMLKLFL